VQAHLDLRGKLLIPIHWGVFTLAFHVWTDPIERVTQAASEHKVNIATPKIGETVNNSFVRRRIKRQRCRFFVILIWTQ